MVEREVRLFAPPFRSLPECQGVIDVDAGLLDITAEVVLVVAVAQTQAEAGQAAVQGAKTLSETDTQGDNGLTALMRQMGLG